MSKSGGKLPGTHKIVISQPEMGRLTMSGSLQCWSPSTHMLSVASRYHTQ
jgi:hypothetical protein